jgi:[methyl-Co(III) methanol-specific corrinoid protein]:coenzyme M methyltransferase
MEKVGVYFPEVHLDAGKMADLSAALGCGIDWGKVDQMPVVTKRPYKIGDEITIPPDLLTRDETRVPLRALSILKKRFGDEVAVVGKVFGPWTLGYHLFGVEEFLINTILAPDEIKKAIATLKEVTVAFGVAQIEAGAEALCLADHATRDLCSPEAYRGFLAEVHAEIVKRLPCPLILHICGDTADRIGDIAGTGMACFHFDSKVPAAKARELAGRRMALMGGTSNFDIIRTGTAESIARDVAEKAACGIDIIGPECAVPLDAPYKNMKVLAAEVKRLDKNSEGGKRGKLVTGTAGEASNEAQAP